MTQITIQGRTGEVDRVESDGTTYVWFGTVRSDGARLCEAFTSTDLYGSIDAATLHSLKEAKVESIDTRTAALIEQGFEFPPGSGQLFSLSLVSQHNLTNAFINRNNPSFTFPVLWGTKDALVVIEITDATMMAQFYGVALMAVRQHRDSGSVLKAQVMGAATPEQLDAIVDTR